MKFIRKDLKVEGNAEVAHVVAYLEQLAQALKSGTAQIARADQQIVLGPSAVVGFSLAASDRGKRQSVTLELSWRKRSVPAGELDLRITSGETSAQETSADAVEVAVAEETSVLTAAADERGEAHEGEVLRTADVSMQGPRGSGDRPK